MIGRTLGHYCVLEQIGAGGMGVVYRARDEHLDRDVAIKVLPPDTFDDDAARRRFRREALALSKLNHPNIATVHDFDTENGVDFLVVELIAGTSLNDLLRSSPLPERDVLHFGQQLSDGVAAAHQEGVVHRDLKPANLRVTGDRRLKILDFGLAKAPQAADETTDLKSLGVAGTLLYMAPEQLSRGQADERTDIWSIGVVLYEMATGRRPFEYSTAPRVASAILTDRPASPASINHHISPGLEQIILKCLEKEPENRYHAAREISVDLRRLTSASPEVRQWRPHRLLLPVAAAVGASALVLWGWNQMGVRERFPTRGPARIESLAVLPLANLSGQPDQEYFSDGMTDALITELAQIKELTVISRTSVIAYKTGGKPMPQIAKELNVDAVVEGSVQRAGDRVAINVQLIHGPTDRHLWAKNYDGNLRDVLGLQREIASAIAGEIRAKLSPKEAARLASRRAVDPVAYEAYLKGFYEASKITKEGLEKGLRYFRQAQARDPNYAPAYYGEAFVYGWQGDWYAPNREVLPKSEKAARRAIELDPSLAEAHTFVAVVKTVHDHDWSAAEQEFRRAIELNPGSALGHRWFGYYFGIVGDFESGLQEVKRSLEIDPLSLEGNALLGNHLYYWRRYDEAIEQYQRTLEMDPNYFWAATLLGQAHEQKRQFREAITAYGRARDTAAAGGEAPPEILAGLARSHAALGETAEASRMLQELESLRKRRYVPPYDVATVHLALGRKTEALDWLEKSYDDRNWSAALIKVEPRLDSLRADRRFQALLARMAFPPTTPAARAGK